MKKKESKTDKTDGVLRKQSKESNKKERLAIN
jgi:hypothetical protein